jgi:Ribonuclease toxin, BrnT, of type II toxin-antitoxin system
MPRRGDSGIRKAYNVYFKPQEGALLEFEFDPEKSKSNKAKHDIDFVEAQWFWLDDMLLEIPARSSDEPRFLIIGTIDNKFDSGGDITSELGVSKARRLNQEPKRINVDFPIWMIESLDREAKRLGVTRQSIIKIWLAEMLERRAS